MDIKDSLMIEPATSLAEIKQMVCVHKEVFSDNLDGEIGRRFIERFFMRVANVHTCAVFVCKDNGKIVGFIAGAVTKKGLLDFRLMFQGAWVSFCQIFLRPKILLNIAMQIKGIFFPSKVSIEPELLTIGLKKEYRGRGVGKRLVERLEKFFIEKGIKEYKVYTDSKFTEGIKLYESLGFELKEERTFFYVAQRLYVKRIDKVSCSSS